MRLNRRVFLKLAGGGWAAAATGCIAANEQGASGAGRPNIVLCMADDQGWGDMAYNGHPALKTPNFDAMAREALRFDRFYAAAPVCTPTRGSVMTGRHPNRFGCFKWGHSLRPQEITIAETLRDAGYVTGHFGKWHLGSVCKGSPVNPGASGFDEWFSAPNFFDNDPIMSREGTAVQTQGESSMVTVDAALEFIRRHGGGDKPFLAVVWFGSPHNPHQAAAEDRAAYAGQPEAVRDFYGEITGMDRAFGKLRRELAALGMRENTVLWYCSDNGGLPQLGVTGGRGYKGQVYEGGLRVPAIIEWPGHVHSGVTDVPCNTSDIYPTLAEIAGIRKAPTHPLDGVSLVPLFQGSKQHRPPMGFWDHPTPGVQTPSKQWMASLLAAQQAGKDVDDPSRLRLDAGEITRVYPDHEFPGHAAWLDWPWKLHRIEKAGRVQWELYNLEQDAQEAGDLAAVENRRVAAMQAELHAWLKSVVKSLNGEDYR
ncbi:MAG: sulfatase-like hydrolase/transferase [Phycisphaerae bacterium]|nr:sulfatase-like hydrolase/transferase [Phycisphaerae bacterium]